MSYELRVVVMDPVNEAAKRLLVADLDAGWKIGGIHKPSIFSRKIVVYLQREKE